MLAVVRRNPGFRRLWFAQIISQLGDWLARVAVLALIGSLGGGQAATGLGMLFAGELAIRLLPATLWGPIAGPLADRLPRRTVMVLADLLRAALALCLLLVDRPEDLPLLYGILIAQMSTSVFFEAARSASLPNTVERDELHEAYALSAATWSTMLAVGAFAGAVLVRWLGVRGLFVLDSITYLASASFLVRLRLPPVPKHAEPFSWRDVLLLRDIRRGIGHVRSLGMTPALFAKTFWGGAGGYLVILSIAGFERLGPRLHDSEGSAAMALAGFATGLLYGARGLGTGIGPIVFRRLWGSSDRALRLQVALGFAIGGGGYVLFGFSGGLVTSFLCVVLAHMGGSALWVGSTTLWQKHVADAYRGRVFACEFLGFTLAFAAGGAIAGGIFDRYGSVAVATWSVSGLVLVMGSLWTLWSRRLAFADAESAVRTRPDADDAGVEAP